LQKIGIVAKKQPTALEVAGQLEYWLRARGVEVLLQHSAPPCRDLLRSEDSGAPGDLSCVIVLGGDGTFLGATRWVGEQDIPILGVKFGDVGFLAETTQEELFPVMDAVLKGRYETEPRTRLSVRVLLDEKEITRQVVLNDVVINKGALARLAHIKTYVDDHYLTTFRADGLIVATPTGSTAYSLAAGGPILHPKVAATLITPICPFTLTNRPILVPDSASIRICLDEGSTDIMLTFDGQAGLEISEKHVILVAKAVKPVRLIKVPGRNYFDVLKAKLRWSGGRV